jgi:hypothetical protein
VTLNRGSAASGKPKQGNIIASTDPLTTPSTVGKPPNSKQAARGGRAAGGGQRAESATDNRPPFVPDSNPYGPDAIAFDPRIELQDGSDDMDGGDESELSQESSDIDAENTVHPQPVYSEFSFPIFDRKRNIKIDWDVKNTVASNVAANPFAGSTKLHWKVLGLGGLSRRKTELECFMLMDVPVTGPPGEAHGQSILGLTNAAISRDQHRRGSDFSK